jgi:3-oxoacyl-[acyl-carrier-protein] synthase-3
MPCVRDSRYTPRGVVRSTDQREYRIARPRQGARPKIQGGASVEIILGKKCIFADNSGFDVIKPNEIFKTRMAMYNSKIAGIGYYVPEKVVTNQDLIRVMDTTDQWIQERTGIKERRYAKKHEETTSTLGAEAAKIAIERAGITAQDVDFIIFATLSPDYYFPGCGVILQRLLGIKGCGALDVRNQCSGFIYALSVADQFVKTGRYKNVLVVGAEFHSCGLDFSTRGRNVTVIFGDGAGAVVLQPTEDTTKGVLCTHLHADGNNAEALAYYNPGSHGGTFLKDTSAYADVEFGGLFMNEELVRRGEIYPTMNGPAVFKMAIDKFPEVIREALTTCGYTTEDINMLIPHQANLRISQFVQHILNLPDDKVYNNIERYGNTTAASTPIALCEAWEKGLVKEGDLVCLAAFGSGFTWASALVRW